MSIITTAFSALGNNSSLYPIIFKDSIDNTGRVAMAYKEGSKNGKRFGVYDARERFIEENGTSVVWIGGIPALKYLYDKLIVNKHYKFQNIKELGSTFDKKGSRALADTNLNLLDATSNQSLAKNLEGIKEAAKTNKVLKTIYDEGQKIIENPSKFKKIQAGKMAVSTLIPLVTVGFVLPKLIQKLTKKIYKHENEQIAQENLAKYKATTKKNPPVFSAFLDQKHDKKNVSFGGKLSTSLVNIFNNDVYNQAMLDAGISGGRIVTGVNTADKIEKGIKEAGVVFFIYLGGKVIANMLEKVGKSIGMPIALDSQILEDKNFHKSIIDIAKAKTPEEKEAMKKSLLHFEGEDEKSVLKFIDTQIANGVENNTFKNTTLKAAQKLGLVELVENVKNPLKMIDTDGIKGLHSSLSEFVDKALSKESPEQVEKFLKKALNTKRGSIVLNLALCSMSTAYFLPKLQYKFREMFTKSSNLPSLVSYDEQIKKEDSKGKKMAKVA